MSKKTKKLLIQMAEYMVAGGAYFWSGYFIIVFLTPVIGLWWANLIGNCVGVTVNFILERYWVFKGSKKRNVTEVSMRYIVLTGFNFLLNYLILLGLKKSVYRLLLGNLLPPDSLRFGTIYGTSFGYLKASPTCTGFVIMPERNS